MAICQHIDAVPRSPGLVGAAPGSNGCQDCLPEHRNWLHLRRCLMCGRILCCDGSPRQHAQAHASSTPHVLMQSFEPGEDWIWCYADEVIVRLPEAQNSPSHDGTREP